MDFQIGKFYNNAFEYEICNEIFRSHKRINMSMFKFIINILATKCHQDIKTSNKYLNIF